MESGHSREMQDGVSGSVKRNEHFIFNALNTIKGAVILEPHLACTLINDFAVCLRFQYQILQEDRMVSFEEEVRQVQAMIHIEMARFSKIEVEFELEETDFLVPPMSLWLLVQDGIYHCLAQKKKGGTVFVVSRRNKQGYQIEVWDDGSYSGQEGHPDGAKSRESREYIRQQLEERAGATVKYMQKNAGKEGTVVWIPDITFENQKNSQQAGQVRGNENNTCR